MAAADTRHSFGILFVTSNAGAALWLRPFAVLSTMGRAAGVAWRMHAIGIVAKLIRFTAEKVPA